MVTARAYTPSRGDVSGRRLNEQEVPPFTSLTASPRRQGPDDGPILAVSSQVCVLSPGPRRHERLRSSGLVTGWDVLFPRPLAWPFLTWEQRPGAESGFCCWKKPVKPGNKSVPLTRPAELKQSRPWGRVPSGPSKLHGLGPRRVTHEKITEPGSHKTSPSREAADVRLTVTTSGQSCLLWEVQGGSRDHASREVSPNVAGLVLFLKNIHNWK